MYMLHKHTFLLSESKIIMLKPDDLPEMDLLQWCLSGISKVRGKITIVLAADRLQHVSVSSKPASQYPRLHALGRHVFIPD